MKERLLCFLTYGPWPPLVFGYILYCAGKSLPRFWHYFWPVMLLCVVWTCMNVVSWRKMRKLDKDLGL